MKAILVIDIGDNNIKDVEISYLVQKWNGELVKAQVEHIPLKPMPKKIDDRDNDLSISIGWNACIDEILGETK